ncbi:MAG: peroxide stress protein YaaA [Magnetococcales bacterium]|nr:peroxide stress protein YaaA [Magnetococcales bacterium]NGZ04969.1 peroxide stress protein YaaA [Magnetococcales bacterium]
MIILISPAKTMDPAPTRLDLPLSQPEWLDEANRLATILKGLESRALEQLLGISPALAQLNAERFRNFSLDPAPAQLKPAGELYRGDTYDGLAVATWNQEDWRFAQHTLRILSGLYGLLCPLDGIQPYRLEMSTRLVNPAGKDLYRFWGTRLSDSLRRQLAEHAHPVVVHLASEDYIKAVPALPLLTPVFLEPKPDGLKVIGLLAKRARGAMARFAITRRLSDPEPLKEFTEEGYRYRPELSDTARWVFVRDARPTST